jgi:hypothetical protein
MNRFLSLGQQQAGDTRNQSNSSHSYRTTNSRVFHLLGISPFL